jgi:uncharacterized protein YqjF (DUF2071 family)
MVRDVLSDPLALENRLAARQRPMGSPIGYHRWHDLLFIHWRVPPSVLRPVVPAALEIDTWDGDAWLGVVAFDMTGVRPWWAPSVPGISAFHETNLRTYVHVGGQGPGVYFISLDAASSLAVRIARWRWNLAYYRARMTIRRDGQRIRYTSRRLWPEPRNAHTDLEAELGDWPAEPNGSPLGGSATPSGALAARLLRSSRAAGQRVAYSRDGFAQPGTLEFFLAERYLLYTASRRQALLCGQVHHMPYPLRSARLLRCDHTLGHAAGIFRSSGECSPPCHTMFSPGVTVQVFPLQPVVTRASGNLVEAPCAAYS